jgi:hypothetical protein
MSCGVTQILSMILNGQYNTQTKTWNKNQLSTCIKSTIPMLGLQLNYVITFSKWYFLQTRWIVTPVRIYSQGLVNKRTKSQRELGKDIIRCSKFVFTPSHKQTFILILIAETHLTSGMTRDVLHYYVYIEHSDNEKTCYIGIWTLHTIYTMMPLQIILLSEWFIIHITELWIHACSDHFRLLWLLNDILHITGTWTLLIIYVLWTYDSFHT